MTAKSLCCLGVLLGFAVAAWPASAGEDWYSAYLLRRHAHHKIYKWDSLIALMEANPDVDDADKARAIAWARARIRYWRAVGGPQWPEWPTPCCYTRKPIRIR